MAGQLIEPRSEFASFVLSNGLSIKLTSNMYVFASRLVQFSVIIKEGFFFSLSGHLLIDTHK